jgi:hypothetical protein
MSKGFIDSSRRDSVLASKAELLGSRSIFPPSTDQLPRPSDGECSDADDTGRANLVAKPSPSGDE